MDDEEGDGVWRPSNMHRETMQLLITRGSSRQCLGDIDHLGEILKDAPKQPNLTTVIVEVLVKTRVLESRLSRGPE